MCRNVKLIQLFIAVFFTGSIFGDNFEVPEILRDNVEFWKKIYAEISLKEGIFHDRDYPLVIYKKIFIGDKSGRQRTRYINDERDKVQKMLSGLAEKPESELDQEEKAILSMFKGYSHSISVEDAEERVRFQQGQKERFREGLFRSGAYLDTIRAIFSQYNIPERLIYLPHVESSFNTEAYSKVGAAGLWQFMRGTGKIYMRIDYLIDERRDPVLSTQAAAKLLSNNFNELQSWPLAITAYNHGLNGMKKAVNSTGSRDISVIIQNHTSRTFKFASKNFYGCFLAASEIAKEPEKYFTKVSFAAPIKYNDVKLKYYIQPKVIAQYLGIREEELSKLNPAIRPIVFRQQTHIPEGTTIHVPYSISVAAADSALEMVPDTLRNIKPPVPQYYRVRRGDNIYGIASRFGVSAQDMAIENNISRINRIYAGQVLRIPTGQTSKPEISSVQTERTVASTGGEQKENSDIVSKAEKKSDVQEGFSQDSIKELIMARADTLPGMSNTAFSQFDADIYSLDVRVHTMGNTAQIFVAVDETIGHYAEWLGIPTWHIRQLNQMGGRSSIRIGQHLAIPANNESIESFTQKRLEYHMALEEDFYSQFKVVEVKSKTIRRGETLWDICSSEETVPLWLLKKLNKHTDLGKLMPNENIWIPVIEERSAEEFVQFDTGGWGGRYPYYQESILPSSKPVQRVP